MPWDTLNVSDAVGDSAENVRRNRRLLLEDLGCVSFVAMQQVHSDAVLVVAPGNDSGETVGVGDAMVTDQPGIGLLVQHADCQPVLLADPVRRVVAAVHNGWRGAVRNILGQTVRIMVRRFGATPDHIAAVVGPAIGPCCAEFDGYKELLPNSFQAYKVKKDFFDFRAVSRSQLIASGLHDEHIATVPVCTVCSTAFFSHRRDGKDGAPTGRNGSVIGLLPKKKPCTFRCMAETPVASPTGFEPVLPA